MSEAPTIVLIHGAFADGASWAPVTQRLLDLGYSVAVPPVFNRSLSGDSAYVQSFVEQIGGPVLLAGHSNKAAFRIPSWRRTSSTRHIRSKAPSPAPMCP
jgi:dienelactone hydrolase